MTQIINFYGGPGSGKSTSAALFYYLLKSHGKNAELVREYIKDWAWEDRKVSTYDQLYILGKHVRKESLLYNKVDWIVTDYPILMSIFYANEYCPPFLVEGVKAAALAYFKQSEMDGHKHIHILLKRGDIPYVKEGRYQDKDEALLIDSSISSLLYELKIPFIGVESKNEELVKIYETLT